MSSVPTTQAQSDKWLNVRPGPLAGFEVAATLLLNLLFGFGAYLWLNWTISTMDEKPGSIHLSHESAYLWLTASSVLVLALAASSSLELDRAPRLGEEKLDKLLAEYDVARLSVARRLMRYGSNAGACLAIFVACAGASDYIREAVAEGTEADWIGATFGAIVLVTLSLFLVFASSTIGITIWARPRALATPVKDKYAPSSIAAALEACGYASHFSTLATKKRKVLRILRMYSLELLVLLIPLVSAMAYLIYKVVVYSIVSERPVLDVSNLVPNYFQAYFFVLVFAAPIVACWCSGYATRIMAQKIAARNDRHHTGYLWLSYAWYTVGVGLFSLVTYSVYPDNHLLGFWIICTALLICLVTARRQVPMFGIRARTARWVLKKGRKKQELTLEEAAASLKDYYENVRRQGRPPLQLTAGREDVEQRIDFPSFGSGT